MGNMREISLEECNAVFGGTDEVDEIVVVGTKKDNSMSDRVGFGMGPIYGSLGGYGFSGGGGSGGGSPDFEDGPVDEGDDDGDGVLNRDEEIVVNGPPRMADDWSDLNWKDKFAWLLAFAITNGNAQAADVTVGTDITGKNPGNPYQSPLESFQENGDLALDALDRLRDAASKLPQR